MATGPAAGSPLAAVAARAKSVQRTRQSLGLSDMGPNGPMRAATPPAQPPAATDPAAAMPKTQFAAPAGADPNSREAMIEQTKQFLAQAANGGQQVADAPPSVEMPVTPQAPEPLDQQLTRVGGFGLPLDVQFMRLAGRPPSGRELATYAAYSDLSRQLGRPPTRNELLYRMVGVKQDFGSVGLDPTAG